MISAARRRAFGLTVVLFVTGGARLAHAENAAAAEALFAEGKTLSAQGKWAQACPKFEESQKLDPGMGTLFQLANCHQRIAKTATAWAEFLEVAAEAKTAGQAAREKVARDRARELETKLPRLTISIDANAVPVGLIVMRDGTPVGRGQWSTPLPVDPGSHRVEASAPGKRPWSSTVQVGEAANIVSRVPVLADAPAGVAAAPVPAPGSTTPVLAPIANEPAMPGLASAPPVDDTRSGTGQRIAGGITLAAGVIGAGIGTAYALMSKNAHDDAEPHCRAGDRCDATGVELRNDARRDGTLATIALGVGAAAIVTGAVLWITAPSPSSHSRATAKPIGVGFAPTGVLVRGQF